jgi:site-specific DNA-methyltransferase (adenine-specific)
MHIQPYADNAKKHPKKQIEMIAESIKRFGMNQPIVVDEKGIIIVGHGRYAALQHLGWEVKPEWIMQVNNLTQQEVDAYRLADNKLNESDWDMSLVLESLHDLADAELQRLTGFDMDLLIEGNAEDDDIPDLPDEPRSKLGDIYTLGGHRVMCGDSTKTEDVSKLMDGSLADMVFTDPPYNIDYEGKTKKRLKIENDKFEGDGFYQFLLDAFVNFYKATKPGTAIYIAHADMERINFQTALVDSGYIQKQNIIWVKDSIVLGRQDYHWRHEPILYGWKNDAGKHKWDGDRKQDTVWEVKRPTRSESHPTMKPIELMCKAMSNSSKSGETILDLFLGSGSTLIAAQKMGRVCYGMELDPHYTDVIVQRYVDYVDNPVVLLNGKQIEWKQTESTE